jgi:hypothetical protein
MAVRCELEIIADQLRATKSDLDIEVRRADWTVSAAQPSPAALVGELYQL